jgi:hypothetical protein
METSEVRVNCATINKSAKDLQRLFNFTDDFKDDFLLQRPLVAKCYLMQRVDLNTTQNVKFPIRLISKFLSSTQRHNYYDNML